jgi:hypothetical protein
MFGSGRVPTLNNVIIKVDGDVNAPININNNKSGGGGFLGKLIALIKTFFGLN